MDANKPCSRCGDRSRVGSTPYCRECKIKRQRLMNVGIIGKKRSTRDFRRRANERKRLAQTEEC